MPISLVVNATLLTIVPIMSLFPSNTVISTFLEGAIGLDFCFLLIKLKGLVVSVILRFSDNSSGCFCALKVLVDALVLSLSKNVSIRDAKSAWPIFTPGR